MTMHVELTDLSPVKKTMSIEVGTDEVEHETLEVLRQYRKKARIPGFRHGKVPLGVIRQRFGKEIEEDVRDRIVSRLFHEATAERGLRPVGEPVLDEIDFEAGRPLKFKTTFEVLPALEVRHYKSVEVQRPALRVTDDEVERAIEGLRQARATLVTEEGRAAAAGDVVIADVDGAPAGAEPFHRERVPIEVGSADNLPGFNDGLAGVRAGADVRFPVEYPAQYPSRELAGQTVELRVVVHEVKRREIPALDDEFAKDLGEFADLAALRARVGEDLRLRKQAEDGRDVRQAILDKVLLENPVVLPESLVDRETRQRLEAVARSMLIQGIDPEKAEVDWVEIRKRQEGPARKMVHSRLILDAVAEAEGITVDRREIEQRIVQEARRAGETAERARQPGHIDLYQLPRRIGHLRARDPRHHAVRQAPHLDVLRRSSGEHGGRAAFGRRARKALRPSQLADHHPPAPRRGLGPGLGHRHPGPGDPADAGGSEQNPGRHHGPGV
jgi:trigger factor